MLKLSLVFLLFLPSFTYPIQTIRSLRANRSQPSVGAPSARATARIREVCLGTVFQDQAAADDKNLRRFFVPECDESVVTAYVALHSLGNRSVVLGHYRDSDSASQRLNLTLLADVLARTASNPVMRAALIMVLPGRYVINPRDHDNLLLDVSADHRELIDALSDTAGTEPYISPYDTKKHSTEARDDFQLCFSGPVCTWNARSDGYVIRMAAADDER